MGDVGVFNHCKRGQFSRRLLQAVADIAILDNITKRFFANIVVVVMHEKRGIAVRHANIANWFGMRRHTLPRADMLKQPHRAQRNRTHPSVKGGVKLRRHGHFLKQHDAQAQPRKRNARAHADHAATGDNDVCFLFHILIMRENDTSRKGGKCSLCKKMTNRCVG